MEVLVSLMFLAVLVVSTIAAMSCITFDDGNLLSGCIQGFWRYVLFGVVWLDGGIDS